MLNAPGCVHQRSVVGTLAEPPESQGLCGRLWTSSAAPIRLFLGQASFAVPKSVTVPASPFDADVPVILAPSVGLAPTVGLAQDAFGADLHQLPLGANAFHAPVAAREGDSETEPKEPMHAHNHRPLGGSNR